MSDDLPDSLIPYDEIVQEALRAVVGRVLGEVQASGGLPGSHHFYITFKTQAPGVDIPKRLIERFPDEMTIVLQNKYWDLKVSDHHFEVSLTFNQVAAHLVVNFALQFQVAGDALPEPHDEAENDGPQVVAEDGSNVVTVDFGKKK